MAASVLYMSMSVDGYIAGPNDEPGNPGGDGFYRLHQWFLTPDGEFFRPSGPAGELYDQIMNATGAILVVLIPAFVSWAISAGTAAIATIALLAPVIAVAAVWHRRGRPASV